MPPTPRRSLTKRISAPFQAKSTGHEEICRCVSVIACSSPAPRPVSLWNTPSDHSISTKSIFPSGPVPTETGASDWPRPVAGLKVSPPNHSLPTRAA